MGCIGCTPWQNEGFAELNGSQSHNYGNDNYLATSIYSNLFALWVKTIDYFIRPRKRTATRAVTAIFSLILFFLFHQMKVTNILLFWLLSDSFICLYEDYGLPGKASNVLNESFSNAVQDRGDSF